MIKVKREFNYSTREYFLSNKVICRTNRVTRWYNINNNTITYYCDSRFEPILGPTCLSVWSK